MSEGQEVFLKYGLMANGSIWGHGAYLAPDDSWDFGRRERDDAKRRCIR